MKIEEVISSTIMFVVSGLVLIGFTIAWFTDMSVGPTVTGVQLEAVKLDDIKVALESGIKAKDVSELDAPYCYAEIGFDKYLDVDSKGKKELAPGTCGQVIFYVTPTNVNVATCDIVPIVGITQDGKTWYPDVEKLENATEENSTGNTYGGNESAGENSGDVSDETTVTIDELCEIVQRHIEFYSNEKMTEEYKITADSPLELTWADNDWNSETNSKSEQAVPIYWKWHYEYPFSTDQLTGENALSQKEQETLIRKYDEEDMKLGNNLSGMKFYFTFTAR